MSKTSWYVKTFKVQEVDKVKTINRCLSLWTMRSYLKSPSRHLPWWRHLEDVFRLQRRLDQDEHIRLTHTFSEDVFKTFRSRPVYSPWSYVFKTSSGCLAKTSSRRLAKMSSRHLQDVFKSKTSCENVFNTSSRRFQDVFKMSSRRLPDFLLKRLQDLFKASLRSLEETSLRHLQDVLETYHQVKLFLLTRFQDVFKTYSQCFWDVLQRRLSTEVFT